MPNFPGPMNSEACRWIIFRRCLLVIPGGFGALAAVVVERNGEDLSHPFLVWLAASLPCLAAATWLHFMLTAKIHAVTGEVSLRKPSPTVLFLITQYLLLPVLTVLGWIIYDLSTGWIH